MVIKRRAFWGEEYSFVHSDFTFFFSSEKLHYSCNICKARVCLILTRDVCVCIKMHNIINKIIIYIIMLVEQDFLNYRFPHFSKMAVYWSNLLQSSYLLLVPSKLFVLSVNFWWIRFFSVLIFSWTYCLSLFWKAWMPWLRWLSCPDCSSALLILLFRGSGCCAVSMSQISNSKLAICVSNLVCWHALFGPQSVLKMFIIANNESTFYIQDLNVRLLWGKRPLLCGRWSTRAAPAGEAHAPCGWLGAIQCTPLVVTTWSPDTWVYNPSSPRYSCQALIWDLRFSLHMLSLSTSAPISHRSQMDESVLPS